MSAKKASSIDLNLALQGGGAHGAFTWGVLDRLLQEPDINIKGISGTSAGAMNAVVMAYGLATAGPERAREMLREFWQKTSELSAWSPIKPTLADQLLNPGNMDLSPSWHFFDTASRVFSPYEFNPTGWHPLRDLLNDLIDFDCLKSAGGPGLFLCATNVKTGRIKVFKDEEISVEAVLASACLPNLFQAIEVEGEHYWDGGFMGNPPIFPLIYGTDCEDVLIVQLNPIVIEDLPTTAAEISDRVNELAFNSSLMREMRAIHFVTRLIDDGHIDRERYKRLNIHLIGAEKEMSPLRRSSKINAERAFLESLFDLGQQKAETFLKEHKDKIGKQSSIDIAETFL